MLDAFEIAKQMWGAPFQNTALLAETWITEPEGYRWNEELTIQVWQKFGGGCYARATREDLKELLGVGKSAQDALYDYLGKFRTASALWQKKKKK